ncbi:MAG: hypothetical protein COA52_00540 [Hyphomicrobiales bacterium]|nr:MAG: hypothetical protein COA52_00540 [Hyphomicrobiales bacterium]
MNKIEKVVLPLKADAVERATQRATAICDKVHKHLLENDMDITKALPRIDAYNDSYDVYRDKQAKKNLYMSLVSYDKHDMTDKIVIMNDMKILKFIQKARENAAFTYDKFVNKLNLKIGPVSEAKLQGNHVWDESFLTVKIVDGAEEIWKTKMILNVSKLGLIFNQFPTRKMKN